MNRYCVVFVLSRKYVKNNLAVRSIHSAPLFDCVRFALLPTNNARKLFLLNISIIYRSMVLPARIPSTPLLIRQNELMLRAIIDVNLAKFLSGDVPLFKGIISDLFPSVQQHAEDYTELRLAVDAYMTSKNLQPVPGFTVKIQVCVCACGERMR